MPAGSKGKLFWAPWRRVAFFVVFFLQGLVLIIGGLIRADLASDAFPSGVAEAKERIASYERKKQELGAKLAKLPPETHAVPVDRETSMAMPWVAGVGFDDRERVSLMTDMRVMDILIEQIHNHQQAAREALGKLHWFLMLIALGLMLWITGYYLCFIKLPRQQKQIYIVTADAPPPAENQWAKPDVDIAATTKALNDLNQEH